MVVRIFVFVYLYIFILFIILYSLVTYSYFHSYYSFAMLESFNFQRIVLLVAGLMFAGFMITVVYSMLKANTIGEWPPVIANCPDNWIMDTDGKTCKNANGLFNTGAASTCNSIDTSTDIYSGAGGLCQKHQWSKNCGVNWDGISNNPGVCAAKKA